ncbi:MAG: glycosyltransferase family 4 protein [Methylocystis sp.]|nr:glycosyltransferase family 4 protein [Methylocystis sp.]
MSEEKGEAGGDLNASRRAASEERIRLLEHQLDYIRAEMLHLTHERENMIYSVSYRVFRPLRLLEAKLVDAVAATFRRVVRPGPARTAVAPTPRNSEAPSAPPAKARRLLVDVTGVVNKDAGAGIERVVKRITQALYEATDSEIPTLAVRCAGGQLSTCHEFIASLTGRPAAGADREIAIEAGDRFLMLSDAWNAFDEFMPAFERIRRHGGEIVSCIFDLIPELYPHACYDVTVSRYDRWLRRALLESDSFIAISRTVADELADFVDERALPHRPGLKIGWFHCGSDIAAGRRDAARDKIRAAVAVDAPVFLCVGTIEPRKGHRTALKAFDDLWNGGLDARLVLVGRRGWYDEALVAEIVTHPEFGRRLYWFDDVADDELSFLYDKASAVLCPSYAEGFGLPIAEAARRDLPVICSDIPVFREVGGEGAAYFRVNDPQALARCIRGWLAGEIVTDPSRVSRSSWADAARRIVDVIAHDDWSRRLP